MLIKRPIIFVFID